MVACLKAVSVALFSEASLILSSWLNSLIFDKARRANAWKYYSIPDVLLIPDSHGF